MMRQRYARSATRPRGPPCILPAQAPWSGRVLGGPHPHPMARYGQRPRRLHQGPRYCTRQGRARLHRARVFGFARQLAMRTPRRDVLAHPIKYLGVNASRYMDVRSCRVYARPPHRGEVWACVVLSVAPRETSDSKAPTRGRGPRPHRGPDGPRGKRLQSAHARCRYGRPFSRPCQGWSTLRTPPHHI